jgi:hypothetical protein
MLPGIIVKPSVVDLVVRVQPPAGLVQVLTDCGEKNDMVAFPPVVLTPLASTVSDIVLGSEIEAEIEYVLPVWVTVQPTL